MILSNERVKFYISQEEMESLNLSCSLKNMDSDVYDYNEMVVLAASLDDCQELEPGDIIWAKLTGTCLVYSFDFFEMLSYGLGNIGTTTNKVDEDVNVFASEVPFLFEKK